MIKPGATGKLKTIDWVKEPLSPKKYLVEIATLKAAVLELSEALGMVEDNSKMPHQHSDYYTRLCCLSERARETLARYEELLKQIKGES